MKSCNIFSWNFTWIFTLLWVVSLTKVFKNKEIPNHPTLGKPYPRNEKWHQHEVSFRQSTRNSAAMFEFPQRSQLRFFFLSRHKTSIQNLPKDQITMNFTLPSADEFEHLYHPRKVGHVTTKIKVVATKTCVWHFSSLEDVSSSQGTFVQGCGWAKPKICCLCMPDFIPHLPWKLKSWTKQNDCNHFQFLPQIRPDWGIARTLIPQLLLVNDWCHLWY